MQEEVLVDVLRSYYVAPGISLSFIYIVELVLILNMHEILITGC